MGHLQSCNPLLLRAQCVDRQLSIFGLLKLLGQSFFPPFFFFCFLSNFHATSQSVADFQGDHLSSSSFSTREVHTSYFLFLLGPYSSSSQAVRAILV